MTACLPLLTKPTPGQISVAHRGGWTSGNLGEPARRNPYLFDDPRYTVWDTGYATGLRARDAVSARQPDAPWPQRIIERETGETPA